MRDMGTLQHPSYERLYGEKLTDYMADALILRHKKTGARICLAASDDENKAFCIGFRTPPENSTGVAHIIEHSVLNGCEKYPLKDPFMELAKGSLQTFLNAITYSDKTIYPVASCNDKDFRNLVDVYINSVFHPNIYRNELIFRQEGWRYHLEKEDDPITINGVVYSEMKGSFSDAENQFYQELSAALYPGHTYGNCSGGRPENIPDLTYEQFLDFHRRYYHPSNSYIYLYGDMDMAEYLDYLDREYLSHYDYRPVDSEIPLIKDLGRLEHTYEYGVGEDEEEKGHDFLGFAMKLDEEDPLRIAGFEALTHVMFNAPGALVKQALIDAGIGEDIQCYIDTDLRQPAFIVAARGADGDRADEFYDILMRESERLATEGINKNTLRSYLATSEFGIRESSIDKTMRGLYLCWTMLPSWLHDDNAAFRFCHPIRQYRKLMDLIDTDYFEKMLRETILSHKHELRVRGLARHGVTEAQEAALAEKLKAYKESLTKEQIDKLIKDTEALRIYQETTDKPEDLKKIPLLSISDIRKEAKQFPVTKSEAGGVPVIHYDTATNDIVYLRLIVDMTDLPEEELPYLGLFSSALLRMDTTKHGYVELNDEMRLHVGDMWSGIDTFSDSTDYRRFKGVLSHYVKAISEEMPNALKYFTEMIVDTDFSDKKRLKEILQEDRSGARSGMVSAGNSFARRECTSSFQAQEYFMRQATGYGRYESYVDILEHFDERADEVIKHLNGIKAYALSKERFTFAVTADLNNFNKTVALLPGFLETLKADPAATVPIPSAKLPWEGGYTLTPNREAITFGGRVNYAAQAGNYKSHGFQSGGHLMVLSTILSREYLYQNIRVKGGAYGAGCNFTLYNGIFAVATYRDPNLGKTYDVYRGMPEFVRNLNLDERELTKFVIGTISGMDRPKSAFDAGEHAVNDCFLGISEEQVQKIWDEVLTVTNEKLRAQADLVEQTLNEGHIACFGGEGNVKQETALFDVVKGLQ